MAYCWYGYGIRAAKPWCKGSRYFFKPRKLSVGNLASLLQQNTNSAFAVRNNPQLPRIGGFSPLRFAQALNPAFRLAHPLYFVGTASGRKVCDPCLFDADDEDVFTQQGNVYFWDLPIPSISAIILKIIERIIWRGLELI